MSVTPLDPSSRPSWQLRVLDGSLRGTVFPVGARTSIGRGEGARVQLLDAAVSREHAYLTVDEQGRVVLVDLVSTNGTFVDGHPVERMQLRPHCVVRIAGVKLVFEPYDAVAASSNEILRGDERRTVSLTGPNGVEHGGHALDEILEYRRLRAKERRGSLSEPGAELRLSQLAERLERPPAATDGPWSERRAFARFSCALPATLRSSTGDEIPCEIRDVGVDGAQIHADDHGLEYDDFVWLCMVLEASGHVREEVLTARVAWAEGDRLGMAFAGAPRSTRRIDARASHAPAAPDAPTMRLVLSATGTEDFAALLGAPRRRGRHWSPLGS